MLRSRSRSRSDRAMPKRISLGLKNRNVLCVRSRLLIVGACHRQTRTLLQNDAWSLPGKIGERVCARVHVAFHRRYSKTHEPCGSRVPRYGSFLVENAIVKVYVPSNGTPRCYDIIYVYTHMYTTYARIYYK